MNEKKKKRKRKVKRENNLGYRVRGERKSYIRRQAEKRKRGISNIFYRRSFSATFRCKNVPIKWKKSNVISSCDFVKKTRQRRAL